MVALFITCLTDTLFPQAGVATVDLLARLGVDVCFPKEQTCCGQMHFNSGHRRQALLLARRFVAVFADADVVLAPSASCVAMVRHHYQALAETAQDSALASDIAALCPRVLELSELLVDQLKVLDVGACFPHSVAYHPSCHSLRSLALGERPLRLLSAVDGLTLVDIEDSESCCGFGGTFSVRNSAVSSAILTEKAQAILRAKAEVCTSVDSSCLMQIGGALARQKAGIRVMHLAEILASTAGGSLR